VLELATTRPDESLRTKALLNLALIGLWRARLALAELDRHFVEPELVPEKRRVEAELADQETRLRRLGRKVSSDGEGEVRTAPGGPPRQGARRGRSPRSADETGSVAPASRDAQAREPPAKAWRLSSPVQHIQGMPTTAADPEPPAKGRPGADRAASSGKAETARPVRAVPEGSGHHDN
jgi:hypothetical protein